MTTPKEQQMSDIVERLRKLASIYADPDIDGALWKERDLLTEAADYIERLRTGRAAVVEECAKVIDTFATTWSQKTKRDWEVCDRLSKDLAAAIRALKGGAA